MHKPLQIAIENHNVIQLHGLLSIGVSPNSTDGYATALQQACQNPNYHILKTLLQFGANPNIGERGKNATHTLMVYLEHNGKLYNFSGQIIRFFLEYGADFFYSSNGYKIPLEHAESRLKEITLQTINQWKKEGSPIKKPRI